MEGANISGSEGIIIMSCCCWLVGEYYVGGFGIPH